MTSERAKAVDARDLAFRVRSYFRFRWRSAACIFAMALLTEAVYLRPSLLSGEETLAGIDYLQLHAVRLEFAEDALFGPRHTLPAWYPRELLGAPFAANLQSFPWIPTRLVLLLFDPEIAYAPGVAIAALLAAVFTYLYCRRAGLSEIAAAASGWTFACAGFFASRVRAGHLPLLEAYPSLPLLLWLADRALDPLRARNHRLDLGWLAIASTCIVLAGHPQVPAYALAATLLYVMWRGRGWLRARLTGTIALGSAIGLAAWWPMLLLIQKSTRILDLDPPNNDIAFPYGRILALFNPGIDGWPPGISRAAEHVFSGYPNLAYFYDTASYVGRAPIIAVAALLLICCFRKRLPEGRWMFLAAVGCIAFLGALPLLDFLRHLLPGTILRSPARLLYLTTFSLSIALGAAVDKVLAYKGSRTLAYAAVAVSLGLHGMDLGGFSRLFVNTVPRAAIAELSHDLSLLTRTIEHHRAAVDTSYWFAQRPFDDIGTFDSLLLAKPYRAILALAGASSRTNMQFLNGAMLAAPALQAAGVALVLTPGIRTDLVQLAKLNNGLYIYGVPDPAPRASFYTAESVTYLPEDQIPAALRTHAYAKSTLLLPVESRDPSIGAAVAAAPSGRESAVAYNRPSSDEIVLDVSAAAVGYAEVLESYDPGWSAQVDGGSAAVFPANGFTLAVPVSAGKHVVRFLYRTPGRTFGIALSLCAAGLLALLIWFSRSTSAIVSPGPPVAASSAKPAPQRAPAGQTPQPSQRRPRRDRSRK